MLYVRKTYYLRCFNHIRRVRAPCFHHPASLHNVVVTQFGIFPLFRPPGAPLGAPREPKGAPRSPKATPGASKNRPKSDARTHLGAQAAQEVQKGTHPSGNVSKIDAKVVFPERPPMKKIAMKTPLSSTTFLQLRCQKRAHTGGLKPKWV